MTELDYADISKICERFNVTSRTLRFYEEEGLIESTRILNSSRRKYTEEQIFRIQEILTLRAIGISVAEIKEYLSGNVSLKEAVYLRRAEIVAAVESKMREIRMLNETLMALDNGEELLPTKIAAKKDGAVERVENISKDRCTGERVEIARKCAEYMVAEKFEQVYPYFSGTLTEYMPVDSFKAMWRDSITGVGEFVALGKTIVSDEADYIIFQDIVFRKVTMRLKYVFHDNTIHGLWQSYTEEGAR